MDYTQKLMQQIGASYTAYHAVAVAAAELEQQGFSALEEQNEWNIQRGGKYYVIRDGSSLIAFSVGTENGGFRIVASHTDSPCLKIKGACTVVAQDCAKLNVERYGGGLNYSWLDIPLKIAGRLISYQKETGTLTAKTYASDYTTVIPSVAMHFQREANTSFSLNPQVDLQPLVSLDPSFSLWPKDQSGIKAHDLFLVNATKPYLAGAHAELLVSPRIDNLTSVFASVEAIQDAGDAGISMIFLADNEEVGSATKQGAGSDFLLSVMGRIAEGLGEKIELLLPQSFLVSCDNAHAVHPNHPEKSDLTEPVKLGGGVVIKHHANQNYTTDAFSAAIFQSIMEENDVPFQDFYMRSDMPCGSTLGAISSSHVSIRSVDIGLPQLAMHAATETMAAADYPCLIKALSAFFATPIRTLSHRQVIV